MEIKIEYVLVDELHPYENNARLHQDDDVEAIAASIEEFGFNDPIGIWSGENLVVEGHGRLEAAKRLGMSEVPCIRLDHMTDEQRKAYALAHNKTAELSSWDKELLGIELNSLTDFDMSKFGFSEDERKKKKDVVKGDVPFTEVLGEENNYIVLKFTTDIDWLNACTVFNIGQVKSYSTRKDGKLTDKMTRIGIGRVLDGAKAIAMLMGEDI